MPPFPTAMRGSAFAPLQQESQSFRLAFPAATCLWQATTVRLARLAKKQIFLMFRDAQNIAMKNLVKNVKKMDLIILRNLKLERPAWKRKSISIFFMAEPAFCFFRDACRRYSNGAGLPAPVRRTARSKLRQCRHERSLAREKRKCLS